MASEFLADCAGSDYLSEELITISRRGRKRDTSMAFSPVKDNCKKSRDHLDHQVDDTERMFTHMYTHTHTHTLQARPSYVKRKGLVTSVHPHSGHY